MKTFKYLTLFLLFISLELSAQGLMFNGMENPIDERTSYDVFASKTPKFDDVLRIEFSLSRMCTIPLIYIHYIVVLPNRGNC